KLNTQNIKAYYLLGRAYQYANRFTEAIEFFKIYKNKLKKDDKEIEETEQQIQHCLNGKELVKFPLNVTFYNLGENINSQFADFYPFVTEDESFIVFNSKRSFNKDSEKLPNGQFINNIYISKVKAGEFLEASPIGAPISKINSGDEVIGMNAKGDILLVYKTNNKGQGSIYITSQNAKGQFSEPVPLPPQINGDGEVISACINNDGSVIYFASDRKGGFGGTDLYLCRKLPNGKWGEAVNLGKDVNTKYDEDFPNLSPDGKTIYFSSKGLSSMGGYDIFKAEINEETNLFDKIKNVGYPVNTSFDDYNFRISKNGRYGYVASLRGGGKGDYDIYRVTFNEVEVDYTVIVGNILAKDKVSPIKYTETYITVQNNISNEIIGNYLPNPASGRFIIILGPGKYTLNCYSPDFEDYKHYIEILDKSSYQKEVNMYIELKK
ncbi:MAG: PD40 domain-containing protein, partial [Bacteroidia bacterium]|nr:PD40 domain-containing protein [Bacteroidia bacterium]